MHSSGEPGAPDAIRRGAGREVDLQMPAPWHGQALQLLALHHGRQGVAGLAGGIRHQNTTGAEGGCRLARLHRSKHILWDGAAGKGGGQAGIKGQRVLGTQAGSLLDMRSPRLQCCCSQRHSHSIPAAGPPTSSALWPCPALAATASTQPAKLDRLIILALQMGWVGTGSVRQRVKSTECNHRPGTAPIPPASALNLLNAVHKGA